MLDKCLIFILHIHYIIFFYKNQIEIFIIGTPPRIRTETDTGLSRFPLPVGVEEHINALDHRGPHESGVTSATGTSNRTKRCISSLLFNYGAEQEKHKNLTLNHFLRHWKMIENLLTHAAFSINKYAANSTHHCRLQGSNLCLRLGFLLPATMLPFTANPHIVPVVVKPFSVWPA